MKVHFATANLHYLAVLQKHVNYTLFSYHYIKDLKVSDQKEIIRLLNLARHAIVDSGLFTLMFGGDKSKPKSQTEIYSLMVAYANFIKSSGYRHSFVEFDVQKIFGSDVAWEFRKDLRRLSNPNNTIINVYHLEDGNPDKLISFSDYVAVSVPELRIHCSKKELIATGDYILKKALRKGIRVHMLGCTQSSLIKRWNVAYSCDSSSWLSALRYGELKTDSKTVSEIKTKALFDTFHSIDISKQQATLAIAAKSAAISLTTYEKYAGNQA